MVDEALAWTAPRGRHRSARPAPRWARAARIVRYVGALPRSLAFFSEPFDVLVALYAVVAGVPAMLGYPPPSLRVQLTPWLLHAWGVLLVLGGVATVVSRWRIGRSFLPSATLAGVSAAVRLGSAGMVLLATANAVYGLAICAVGVSGVPAGSLALASAAMAAVRAWVISRQLPTLTAVRAGSSPGLDAGPDG